MSSGAPKFSMEVREDNRHSRLMALQRMGVVQHYEDIVNKSVAIIGIGGVGSVVAEMLTRCAIGSLHLFDYDTVQMANMNRLFFRPDQCGMQKTDAAKKTLQEIDPEVTIHAYSMNISTVDNYDSFKKVVEGVDLVISCVDNFAARMTVNHACLETRRTWIEGGVSENAISGHIQVLVPGATACYQCCPPLVVASGQAEAKREGVCAASLPTTMGIVAGFLAQHALKMLLNFGEVAPYIGYDAMKDYFPSITIQANPECTHAECRKLQEECKRNPVELPGSVYAKEQAAAKKNATEKPRHANNEWGIEISSASDGDCLDVPHKGLVYEYAPAQVSTAQTEKEQAQHGDISVEDLAAQLKSLQ